MKTITDGSVVFTVRDKRIQAMIDMFYPVGSVYISADKSKTKADFPFMAYGTWEEVPANLCLQTGNVSEAGAQRRAGLPNITGMFGDVYTFEEVFHEGSGCISLTNLRSSLYTPASVGEKGKGFNIEIDASKSNSIYGSSDTVQPPAYMVRAWVRTA